MSHGKFLVLSVLAIALFCGSSPAPAAQVAVDIGVAPVCPYGYFDYPPYDCAPYGYYGPDWFIGGVFIGAGPWFHGHPGFYGHVDNRFDPHHGYNGPVPMRGQRAPPARVPCPSSSGPQIERIRSRMKCRIEALGQCSGGWWNSQPPLAGDSRPGRFLRSGSRGRRATRNLSTAFPNSTSRP